MSNKVQAVILAGGRGSRLRPYTTVVPKPLMPVGEFPIIEIVIRQLKFYGLKNIAVSTGYLAGLIETYLGDGSRFGVNISYVHEHKALGTAGALKLIKNLNDNFLVINGDILTDLNFRELLKFHQKQKAAATLTVKQRDVRIDFGVVEFDGNRNLKSYLEKPHYNSFVSLGINCLHKSCQQVIASGEKIGMPDLLLRLKEAGKKVVCCPTKKFWLDLGRLEDLELAQELWQSKKRQFLKA